MGSPRLAIGAYAVLLVAAAGCEEAALITAEVQSGAFVIDIETRGELAAVNSQAISRPRRGWSRGQIVRLVEEGKVVEKGDFLVQFDTTEAERELAERQNAYENALAEQASTRASAASRMAELESQLKTQEYSFEQAKIRFEQMEYEADVRRREQELELRKAELSLQEARDRIESQRVVDAANLRKAQIAVDQARVEVERGQEALDAQTLTAPLSGLVVYREIWKGSSRGKIAVGDQPWPGQELFEIPDLSAMMVKTKVNEVDVHRVALDQKVRIEVDALEGLELTGKVSRLGTLAQADEETEGETKSFEVEVVVDSSDERLRPGMTALCSIVVGELDDVLSVPLDAVFDEDGRTVCYVVDGGVQARDVVLGPRNRDFVVVKEGLAAGDRISLRDPRAPIEEIEDEEIDEAPARPAGGGAAASGDRPRRGGGRRRG